MPQILAALTTQMNPTDWGVLAAMLLAAITLIFSLKDELRKIFLRIFLKRKGLSPEDVVDPLPKEEDDDKKKRGKRKGASTG